MSKYTEHEEKPLCIVDQMNKLYFTTDFSAVRFDLRESISNTA